MRANDAICNIACHEAETGNFVFINKGWVIIWTPLINDSAKSFSVYVWATRYSTSIPINMQ